MLTTARAFILLIYVHIELLKIWTDIQVVSDLSGRNDQVMSHRDQLFLASRAILGEYGAMCTLVGFARPAVQTRCMRFHESKVR